MRIFLPNSANLQNITAFLSRIERVQEADELEFSMHPKWVAVHPVVLAITACAAAFVRHSGGTVQGEVAQVSSLPYLIRMKLFDHLGIDPKKQIVEHEESGRFIPLTQIRNTADLKNAIANLVPLLHAPPEVADPVMSFQRWYGTRWNIPNHLSAHLSARNTTRKAKGYRLGLLTRG